MKSMNLREQIGSIYAFHGAVIRDDNILVEFFEKPMGGDLWSVSFSRSKKIFNDVLQSDGSGYPYEPRKVWISAEKNQVPKVNMDNLTDSAQLQKVLLAAIIFSGEKLDIAEELVGMMGAIPTLS